MRNITEEEAKGLGFVLAKKFYHDEYLTNRYEYKGVELDFTYKDSISQTVDITGEYNCLPLDKGQLELILPILTQQKQKFELLEEYEHGDTVVYVDGEYEPYCEGDREMPPYGGFYKVHSIFLDDKGTIDITKIMFDHIEEIENDLCDRAK